MRQSHMILPILFILSPSLFPSSVDPGDFFVVKKGQFVQVFRYLSKYQTKRFMNLLFKALNDSTRRAILEMLRDGDLTAGDIADRFEMTKPSISHHLDLLRQADLVTNYRRGQFIYYSLNMSVLDEIAAWLSQFKKS